MVFFDPFADSTKAAYDRIAPPASTMQAAEAALRLGQMGTATGLLEARDEREKFRSTDVYDPVRLNQLYPGLEKPFTKPTPIGVANSIARRNEERRKLQRILQEGPQNAFQSVLNFAAQTAPHAVDKWEFAAGIAGSMLFGLALGPVGVGAGLGTVAARSFVGNLAGNALIEPLIAYQTAESQEKYGAEDAFMSVVGGAILGTTLEVGGVGGKRIYDGFKAADGNFKTRLKTAIAQAVKGKRINVDVETPGVKADGDSFEPPPIPKDAQTVRSSDIIPPLPDRFTRNLPPPIPVERIPGIPNPDRLPELPNVATGALQGGRIRAGGLIGDTEVLYVGPQDAAGTLTRKGNLADFDISNLRILDATIPRDGATKEVQALIDDLINDTEVSLKNPTLQQAIEAAPNKVRDFQYREIKSVLNDLGYDGVSFKDTIAGKETTGINVFRLEEGKASNFREFNPKQYRGNGTGPSDVKRSLLSTEADQYYDADLKAKYDTLPDGIVEERQVEVPELVELDRENLSPVGKKLAEETDALKARYELDQKALKAAYTCLR